MFATTTSNPSSQNVITTPHDSKPYKPKYRSAMCDSDDPKHQAINRHIPLFKENKGGIQGKIYYIDSNSKRKYVNRVKGKKHRKKIQEKYLELTKNSTVPTPADAIKYIPSEKMYLIDSNEEVSLSTPLFKKNKANGKIFFINSLTQKPEYVRTFSHRNRRRKKIKTHKQLSENISNEADFLKDDTELEEKKDINQEVYNPEQHIPSTHSSLPIMHASSHGLIMKALQISPYTTSQISSNPLPITPQNNIHSSKIVESILLEKESLDELYNSIIRRKL